MSAKELAACIDWAAPGFEVVYSVFPGWNFTAADAAAAFGVHGALFIGERRNLDPDGTLSAPDLADFSVTLKEGNGARSDGHARNVLGGPMEALKFLVEELARYPICEPLKAGEVVTTGTLTAAMPVEPGQAWRASFRGIDFAPLCLRTA